ncbi:MAG: hypothetical protein LBO70_07595, partial [Clostridiales Family XIII bacterium]|nr:hypothetical protein [Clostridiales Family XIII bacterium]
MILRTAASVGGTFPKFGKLDRPAKGGFACAPGMGDDLVVKVHYRLGSRNRELATLRPLLAKGKGVRR